ncbi:MAG: hypothetical protein DRI99_07815, partial [Candidatus Aminicenantes bacterium]
MLVLIKIANKHKDKGDKDTVETSSSAGSSRMIKNTSVFIACFIVTLILITGLSGVVSVSAAVPSITNWSSTGGSPTNKDNPQDLIYRVQPEDTITFTVTANETCNFTWKVMLGAEVLQTHEENNTKTSSFTWTVPNETSTWDMEVETSNYKPVLGPYKQDHKVWTITTSELITVNPGEDIQAALDSLPEEGGVVELKEGTWNLSNADTPIQINRSNTTLRGQGKNKTILHATEILDGAFIQLSSLKNVIHAVFEDVYFHGFSREGGDYYTNIPIDGRGKGSEDIGWDAYTKYSDLLIDEVHNGFQYNRARENLIQYCTVEHVKVFIDCWTERAIIRHNIFRHGGTGAVIKFNGGSDNIFTNNIVEHVAGWAVEPYGICPRVTITNNIIRYVRSGYGIRMWTYGSLVKGNIIHDVNGDGIRVFDCWAYSDPSKNINNITNNLIYNNKGSGITTQVRDTTIYTTRTANIMNNIIYENEKNGITCNGLIENNGVPVYVYNIKNNIITKNKEYGINYIGGKSINLSYNDVYNNSLGNYNGTSAGMGDISVDPLFADPDNGDFHLKSQYGRWNGSGWVNDNETSPCVDPGDPEANYSSEPKPNGGRINIGAYGNTGEASMSSGLGLDTTPPIITTHSPTGAHAPVTTTITVTFSEAMNKTSAESAFSISPSISGTFSWDSNSNKMIFTPSSNLNYETAYTVIISTEAEDLAGNNLESPFSWQFTTASETTLPSPPIVYVATDGTGDYNCDGTDDQIEINQAISDINSTGGGTVHLKAGTYIISDSISLSSNLIFEGEGMEKTIIKIEDGSTKENWATIAGEGISSTTIKNLTIDGNKDNCPVPKGIDSDVDAFHLYNSLNLTVENVKMIDFWTDGVEFSHSSDSAVKDCEVIQGGHEGLRAIYSENITFTNNYVYSAGTGNAGVRIYESSNCIIENNCFNVYGFGILINPQGGVPCGNNIYRDNYIEGHYGLPGIALWP